jgi:LysM repeat protein
LIAEVNALREATGKSQYEISPILMQTAQAQADYMASIELITHLGPGGITTTNRLLAAGYPLAGDLSLGGIRSENIGGGPGMTVVEVITSWKGDDAHYNTMTSPNNTQIGAGIATSGEDVYYVIDCARPIGAKTPYLTNTPAPTSEGGNPGQSEATDNPGYVNLPGEGPLASSLFTTTPDSGRKLYHVVKPGETLWLIAISYGVKIADIRRLNYMAEADAIYPNEKLLIREGVVITPVPPKPSNTPIATPTVRPTQTLYPSPTITLVNTSPAVSGSAMLGVGALVAVVLILIGIILPGVRQSDERRVGW